MTRGPRAVYPEFKLWLSTSATKGVFGDGKWRLLKAIHKTGSLKAAAESIGMSYRKAWGDLNKAEKHLGVALIRKQHGGKTGGGTRLTEAGNQWVRAYTALRTRMEKTADKTFKKHIEGLNKIGRTD